MRVENEREREGERAGEERVIALHWGPGKKERRHTFALAPAPPRPQTNKAGEERGDTLERVPANG